MEGSIFLLKAGTKSGTIQDQATKVSAAPQHEAQNEGAKDIQMEDVNEQTSFKIENCYNIACRQEYKLSVGCKVINEFLRGGFLPKRLYEIYGESGSGKTQLAIQLLLNSVLPVKNGGLDGKALYVLTSKHLNEKRFNEMKEFFLIDHQGLVTENQVRENIIVNVCKGLEDYNKVFINLTSQIEQDKIKLVIVDNIHSVCENFIKADGSVDFIERSNFLIKHQKQIKKISYHTNLVFIMINNVVADIGNDQASKGFFEAKSKGSNVQASLGLLWSNCINERISLKKKGNTADNIKRHMIIEQSSYMRKSELEFEISNSGIKGRH